MANPRILLWDIETSHNIVAAFQLRNRDSLPASAILQERYIICAAWKRLGETRTHSVLSYIPDDKAICTRLYKELCQTDVLVAHNGDSFDLRYLETRLLFHGFPPLPPITSVDTLKIARKRFRFNSNRLDYLGSYLGVGRKRQIEQGLWLLALKGNQKAIRELAEYNKQDVTLLEAVFEKLRPYIPARLFTSGVCGHCGSRRTQHRGRIWTRQRSYQRLQCLQCGGWSQIPHALETFPSKAV
jgi:DNA polymerase elongation subunit (family B)